MKSLLIERINEEIDQIETDWGQKWIVEVLLEVETKIWKENNEYGSVTLEWNILGVRILTSLW